jgi:hypothetical protein
VLIAVLVLLGVDLVVVVALAVIVVGRRRWLKRQPGEFGGAIRITSGNIDGLSLKWKRGSGRWVGDVLVWSKAPFLYRNELLLVDHFAGEHQARPDEVKKLGNQPLVFALAADGAKFEVAARPEHRALVVGPLATGTLTR